MQSFSERDGDAEHPFFTEVEIFRHIGHGHIAAHENGGGGFGKRGRLEKIELALLHFLYAVVIARGRESERERRHLNLLKMNGFDIFIEVEGVEMREKFGDGLGIALLCGALIAFTYTRRTRFTQSLVLAVILLPFAVQTVIMLVNGNVGTGVAVAGAFGLVRFRSAPGNAKDISVIFVAMAVGLACGSGYIALSVLFTVIACAVLYLLVFFHIGADRSGEKELSITIPESLDYTEVFDDIFKEYTIHAELTEVKTASLGSLYKLHYRVRLANDRNEKGFLDALRCRNGNLEVRCGQPHTPVEQL